MIEFRTLGTLDLRRRDGPMVDSLLAQPKRIALLAYLCIARPHGFHRRDTLLGLFWPESDQTRARASLRRALHVLRRSFGENSLHSRGDEEIAVNFDDFWCDCVAFDKLLAENRLVDALELYRGDLLPGFFLSEAPIFERWLDEQRNRLRSAGARAARLVAERQEAEHNLTEAVRWAHRAVELTDNDERAVRRLMELLARAGDRAGALKVYDDFATQLAADMEAEPSTKTRVLADRLRSVRSPSQSERRKVGELSPPIPGSQVTEGSRYQIDRELGRGGSATVFLARDLKHGRSVALKVLRPEIAIALGTHRFFAEIAIAARLNHPNIVTLLDSGEIDCAPFYTMPLIEGETLRERIRRQGALDIADALRITRDVAEALSYAHAHGVVHRDVKPENILLDNGRALVTDFGIARAIAEASGQRLTQPGLTLGTVAYMSPEQTNGGEVDVRTDVYSLGCVVYEMLAGDPPFTGSNKQALLARKSAQPAPPLRPVRESISRSLEQTILKALARTPADRFSTVKEFADALSAACAETAAVAANDDAPQPSENVTANDAAPITARRSVLRSRWLVTAGVGALAVALAAVLLLHAAAAPAKLPPTARKKLTFSGIATQGVLSPNGQFLAYLLEERDSERVIVQDLTGGPSDTILAFVPTPSDRSMEWSSNSARLLVRLPRKVLLVHRRGGNQEPVRSFRPSDHVDWLPDGVRISLSNLDAGRFLIVNPESGDSSIVHIPATHSGTWDGAWSPDGRLFAVVTDSPDSARWAIRGVTLDGRVQELIADSVQLNSPRWSANGDVLYYLRGTEAIWRVNVSTQSGTTTSAPAEVETGIDALPGTYDGIVHFSLSLERHQLVYAKGERYSNIYRVEPIDSTTPPRMQRLTEGTALRWSPVVSPDGQWIAFAAQTKDGSEVFRMPIGGGQAIPVTSGARVGHGARLPGLPMAGASHFRVSEPVAPRFGLSRFRPENFVVTTAPTQPSERVTSHGHLARGSLTRSRALTSDCSIPRRERMWFWCETQLTPGSIIHVIRQTAVESP